MSREIFAKALSGPISLMEDEWRERPVDRLHALAAASRESYLASLGVSIVALRDSNRPDEYARAVDKLTRFLKEMKPRGNKERCMAVARQTIQESVISFCPRCHGAREIPAQEGLDGAQKMIPCPPPDEINPELGGCGGTGKRRYSDGKRLEALQVERKELDAINAQIAYAHRVLAMAESEAIRGAIRLLERW